MKNLLMKKMDGKRSKNESNIYANIFSWGHIDIWRTEKTGINKSKS